jgi:hypothetical protein
MEYGLTRYVYHCEVKTSADDGVYRVLPNYGGRQEGGSTTGFFDTTWEGSIDELVK